MIIITLKDGIQQYWTEEYKESSGIGGTWLSFDTTSKKGAVQHHLLLKSAVQEITDVGETSRE